MTSGGYKVDVEDVEDAGFTFKKHTRLLHCMGTPALGRTPDIHVMKST